MPLTGCRKRGGASPRVFVDAPRLRQVAYVPGAWLGASAWDVAAAGDGELLMGLGSLATVALQRPPNLAIVALDNGRYGETGMQPSHTAGPTRLAAVASGCGIAAAYDIETDADLDGLMRALAAQTDLVFARVAIAPEEADEVHIL